VLFRSTRLSSLATLPRARIPQVRSGAVRTRVGTRRGLRDRGLGGGGDQSGNGKGQGGALHVDSPPRGPPILGASGGGKPFQTRYRCLTRAFSRCASTPCQRETCGGLTPLVAAAAAAAPGAHRPCAGRPAVPAPRRRSGRARGTAAPAAGPGRSPRPTTVRFARPSKPLRPGRRA